MANRLSKENSPYLLQHQDQPVDWFPWGQEAFDRARAEDKPVFLSIGYSTCHWCHVMARESFGDAQVASVLNDGFISVKVDREQRPDIDAVYMAACQAMTGSGGWPLTAFLTADGKPFFAGTYFPKEHLLALLERVTELWATRRELLLRTGEQLTGLIGRTAGREGEVTWKMLQRALARLEHGFDEKWGGFGPPPKFPAAHNLLFLMQTKADGGQGRMMAERTLQAMARGGIFDQIGGGFSRYSTDEKWLIPHFEKMLYDNALLLLAYLKAYSLTGKESYADTARRTAGYILREMTAESGGFYSGQDADSDGEEGKYYQWTQEEAKRVLGEKDGAEFCRRYGIGQTAKWKIPHRIGQGEPPWPAGDERLEKLREYRQTRTKLHRDDKILVSWNSWMIIAMAQAARILGEEQYRKSALEAQRLIAGKMTDDRGRLMRCFRDGRATQEAVLDDYAVYTLALLALYRETWNAEYLEAAVHWASRMRELFEDREGGGYFMTAAGAEALIARPKETYDGAMPSGNSAAALVLESLAELTGEPQWREAAGRQLRFLAGQAEKYPEGHCFAMLAMEKALSPHRQLLAAAQKPPAELTEYLTKHPAENMSILFKSEENAAQLARCAPFTDSYPVPEKGAVWYLCENGACRAPVTDFAALGL